MAPAAGPKPEPIPWADAPFLPQLLKTPFDNYSAEERRVHAHAGRLDFVGLAVLPALYLLAAWSFGDASALPQGGVPANAPALALRVLLAATASYVWYCQHAVIPKVSKDHPLDFEATKGPVGRYIWLTHQTITWQMVHQVSSLLVPLMCGARLAHGTCVLSFVVGALGTFVTIQFHLLVRGDEQFIDSMRIWAKKGVHQSLLCDIVHVPHLFLGAADLLLCWHRATLLAARPSMQWTACFLLAYTVCYLALVIGVNRINGSWPYGLCEALGRDWGKWGIFLVTQFSVLFSLYGALLAGATLLPAAW